MHAALHQLLIDVRAIGRAEVFDREIAFVVREASVA